MNEETDFSAFIKNRITELRCQKGISEYTLSLAIVLIRIVFSMSVYFAPARRPDRVRIQTTGAASR